MIDHVIPELEPLLREWKRAPDLIQRETREAMDAAVLVTEAEVVERTPVDKGRARNAISSHVRQAGPIIIGEVRGANLEYLPYLEWGTGLHNTFPGGSRQAYEIRPKHGKALAFQAASGARLSDRRPLFLNRVTGRLNARPSRNTMILVRKVIHPGIRGHHMFAEGAQAAFPEVRRLFFLAAVRVNQELAK